MPNIQALGDSRKDKLNFNRKEIQAEPGSERKSTTIGWWQRDTGGEMAHYGIDS